MDVTLHLKETYSFPAGTELVYAEATGNFVGLRLPSGELLKPWVTFELAEDENGDECEFNLDSSHLDLRDIHPALDFERHATTDE